MTSDTSNRANAGAGLLHLFLSDNVMVALRPLAAGEHAVVSGIAITLSEAVLMGHKVACQPIPKGAKVLKYGAPIGTATQDIPVGVLVHLHNIRSNYTATHSRDAKSPPHNGGAA